MEQERLVSKNNRGFTILDDAAKSGCIQILSRALDLLGSDIQGPSGETASHSAAASGKLGLVRYLVECRNFDVMARDTTNRLPMEYALFSHDKATELYLAQASGSTNNVVPRWKGSPRQVVQSWLVEIGRQTGASIRLNAAGMSSFTYENISIVIEVPSEVGSFYIYAPFDGKVYDIRDDAYKMLLQNSDPFGERKVFCSLESLPNKHTGKIDALACVAHRIEGKDVSQFRSILENFIDSALTIANRLTICATRQLLRKRLSDLLGDYAEGTTRQNGKIVSDALEHIHSYVVEPSKAFNLASEDKQVFRRHLSAQMLEITKAIGKPMRVNENGMCSFTYEQLTVAIEPGGTNMMAISSTLWTASKDWAIPKAVLRKSLQLNWMQQETRGGAIMMNKDSKKELFFMYCDRVDFVPLDFRNILENFITTALALHKEIRNNLDLVSPDDAVIDDYTQNRKAEVLNNLRLGNHDIVESILGMKTQPKKLGLLERLISTVSDTCDDDLWKSFIQFLVSRVNGEEATDLGILRKKMIERGLDRRLITKETLDIILTGASSHFELETLFTVFTNKSVIADGSVVVISQMLIDSYKSRCQERGEEPKNQVLDDWTKFALNTMNVAHGITNSSKIIEYLEWIFDQTSTEDLDNKSSKTQLLNLAASQGNVELLKFFLRRFPDVLPGIDTLSWAYNRNREDVVEYLVEKHSASIVSEKDEKGKTLVDHMLMDKPGKPILLIKKVLEGVILSEMTRCGLERWKSELSAQLELMEWNGTASERRRCWNKVLTKLALVATVEATSILELALWKGNIKQLDDSISKEHREHCRVVSGADEVMPNVIPNICDLSMIPFNISSSCHEENKEKETGPRITITITVVNEEEEQ